MNFQISIRGALYFTTAIAVYSAILALGYRGDFWGQGIAFAVTCALGLWLVSAVIYWILILVMKIRGVQEQAGVSSVPDENRVSPSIKSIIDGTPESKITSETPKKSENP